jgi:hypothetical protein
LFDTNESVIYDPAIGVFPPMATKAKSIAAADLAKITQAAVKKVSGTGRIVKGPIWGYVLSEKNMEKQLGLATAVTQELAASAKAAGFTGLKAQPSVTLKPGKIIAGFIERELNFEVS